MRKINYNVECNKDKIDKKQKEDTKYLIKKMVEIIYKRRELDCYEKSSN